MIRIITWLISGLGWVLAKLPDYLLKALAWALGRCIYWGFAARRRLVLQSLAYAFPSYTEGLRRALAIRIAGGP